MTVEDTAFPLVARRRVHGSVPGTLRSFRRGTGNDLAGYRPYRPGDDVRRIDHRASARLVPSDGRDELVVRDDLTEDRGRVVIAVDRRPSMALFGADTPWLCKPRALVAAGRAIAAAAREHRCLLGYLDDADAVHPEPAKRAESPFWRAPDGSTDLVRVRERYLPYAGFHAPEDTLDRLLGHLLRERRALPPGTVVFVLSDFLAEPAERPLAEALARGWDIVPVVLRDPRWERSFPDVSGVPLALADPVAGRTRTVTLTGAEVARQREAHERREERLAVRLAALGLDRVDIASDDPGAIGLAFEAWAASRRLGTRIAR